MFIHLNYSRQHPHLPFHYFTSVYASINSRPIFPCSQWSEVLFPTSLRLLIFGRQFYSPKQTTENPNRIGLNQAKQILNWPNWPENFLLPNCKLKGFTLNDGLNWRNIDNFLLKFAFIIWLFLQLIPLIIGATPYQRMDT